MQASKRSVMARLLTDLGEQLGGCDALLDEVLDVIEDEDLGEAEKLDAIAALLYAGEDDDAGEDEDDPDR